MLDRNVRRHLSSDDREVAAALADMHARQRERLWLAIVARSTKSGQMFKLPREF